MMDRKAIKAWKISKRNKVSFRPTENLTEHLRYHPHQGVVYLFHRTDFLEAQLKLSSPDMLEKGITESLVE